MTVRRGDLALGIAAVAFAAAYLHAASGIGESLLSDTVGAAGVPRGVGWAIGAVGVLLCVRSLSSSRPQQDDGPGAGMRPHLRALGLLAILAGYVALAPFLGYAVTTGLLVAAGAWYAGAARTRYLLIVPAIAAFVFWLLFVQAFGISMPGGSLFGAG